MVGEYLSEMFDSLIRGVRVIILVEEVNQLFTIRQEGGGA